MVYLTTYLEWVKITNFANLWVLVIFTLFVSFGAGAIAWDIIKKNRESLWFLSTFRGRFITCTFVMLACSALQLGFWYGAVEDEMKSRRTHAVADEYLKSALETTQNETLQLMYTEQDKWVGSRQFWGSLWSQTRCKIIYGQWMKEGRSIKDLRIHLVNLAELNEQDRKGLGLEAPEVFTNCVAELNAFEHLLQTYEECKRATQEVRRLRRWDNTDWYPNPRCL